MWEDKIYTLWQTIDTASYYVKLAFTFTTILHSNKTTSFNCIIYLHYILLYHFLLFESLFHFYILKYTSALIELKFISQNHHTTIQY